MSRYEAPRRFHGQADPERSRPANRETVPTHVGWHCSGDGCSWRLNKPLPYYEAAEEFGEHNRRIHGSTSKVRLEKTIKHKPKS